MTALAMLRRPAARKPKPPAAELASGFNRITIMTFEDYLPFAKELYERDSGLVDGIAEREFGHRDVYVAFVMYDIDEDPNRTFDQMMKWLDEFDIHFCTCGGNNIFFANLNDAIFFKLRWA